MFSETYIGNRNSKTENLAAKNQDFLQTIINSLIQYDL